MGKIFALIVMVLMPPGVPPMQQVIPMESLEACWPAAQDFVHHELTPALREKGATGLSAACAHREAPSQEN